MTGLKLGRRSYCAGQSIQKNVPRPLIKETQKKCESQILSAEQAKAIIVFLVLNVARHGDIKKLKYYAKCYTMH